MDPHGDLAHLDSASQSTNSSRRCVRASKRPRSTIFWDREVSGLVMIGLGVGSLVWALIDYKAQMKGLHQDYKQCGRFEFHSLGRGNGDLRPWGSRLCPGLPASMNPANSLSADAALARLAAGNERFVRGRARFPTVQRKSWRSLPSASVHTQLSSVAATRACRPNWCSTPASANSSSSVLQVTSSHLR